MQQRIVISIPAFARGKGGAERTAATVAELFARQGHDVAIVCNRGVEGAPSYPVPEGVEFIPCDYFSLVPRKRAESYEAVEAFDPTAVIIFYADASLYKQLMFFQRFNGVALLAQECTNPIRAVRNFRNSYRGQVDLDHAFWLRQAGLAQLDAVRFTIPDYISSTLPALRPRARGFYNSFEFGSMEQPPQAERRRIVSVGGLKDLNKNGMVAAEAFARIAHRHPEWTLEFFGEDRAGEDLKKLARAKGLQDRIISHGVVHSLEALYQGAAISVMTSFEEGNPNVVNEGMAYGVPTIGFADCPGVSHLITDGETGVLVSRNSEVANLASGLERMIGSVELREKIERNGRRTVARRCDHDVYVEQWRRTLEHAVARKQKINAAERSPDETPDAAMAALDEFYDIGMDAFRREEDRIAWALGPADTPTRKVEGRRPRSKSNFKRQYRRFVARLRDEGRKQLRAIGFYKTWITSFWKLGRARFGAYDRVVLHDVMGVLGALWLAGGRRSRIVVDICETPNLHGRTTELFRDSRLPFHWIYQTVTAWVGRGAGHVLLQSPDLAEAVQRHFKRDGMIWAHVRTPQALKGLEPAKRIKVQDPKTIVVAWPSDFNDATGAAFARDLLDEPDADIHMVFIGAKIRPTILRDMRRAYGDRISSFGRMSEDEYLALIKECDVALVAFNPAFENTRLCLPNRFLDCLQVGIPVVSTPHLAVQRVLERHPENGIVTQARDVEEVWEAMGRARQLDARPLDHQAISDALGGASVETVQQSIAPAGTERVAVIAHRDVTDRPRFRQLVQIARLAGREAHAFSRGRSGKWVVDTGDAFSEDARR